MSTGIFTVTALVAFIAGVAWAYSKRRKPDFDAAARIPLEDQSENNP
ncbi:MAG: CcoQ/FixQ family Cbb3-type cytochrome c oxidase assembly chaperone [Lysobacteraceae bacterium]|nr:MAG: CcoQ/FixQ family Cbb3-type cytochrome c oxidase assembly chaperone [Xanthomonadaceae bacterium]